MDQASQPVWVRMLEEGGALMVWAVVFRRAHVAVRRVPESRIYAVGSSEGNAFARRGDAVDFGCRMAAGRRLLVERPNGTFAPRRCGRST
jgi:hypothetical protein